MQRNTQTKHVYLNITEIRGMPLIVIEAYQALFIILILIFVRWIVFAVEHTCRGHNTNNEIVATAHPVRRVQQWIHSTLSPRTRQTSSYFSDGSSVETKEDEPTTVSPTAAEILPTEGLRSYG